MNTGLNILRVGMENAPDFARQKQAGVIKRLFVPLLSVYIVVFFASCAISGLAQRASPSGDYGASASGEPNSDSAIAEDWPLTFSSAGAIYSIFAPQPDSWNGHEFIGRSAVSVQAPGQSQPIYGTIELNAITLVDKNTRTVKLADMKVTGANFPTARAQAQNYLAALRGSPQRVPSLPLDRVQGSLTLPPPSHTQRLNNTPPRIITATRPAVLVSIDGPPVLKPVQGTSMERVINTRVLLFRDASGRYYLHLFDGYLQANSLEDKNWTVTTEIPDGAALAQQQALVAGNVDLMAGSPDATTGRAPSLSTSAIPDVFVSTTPAELITFSGQPEFAPISGTDLLYADNTSADVFKLLTDQQNYILLAGRWYRAPSLDGPWQFVPGNELPQAFANIPDNSPKENVKASVPGTQQAQEALVANSIPQSAAVPRNQQMPNPQIDGPPQLAPIDGTPLYYVVNSATPIIKVDPQSWYACEDGVWYFSTSANGPWSVAASVPSVIYTIPTSSPLHYLTYVQVYGSAQDQVYEGYTPGYMGTEVGDDGTVVYGTGYDYQPWIGSDWISPPVTWGFGFAPTWTPWWGWGFNSGFGWGCGFPRFRPWVCGPPFPFFAGFRGFHAFGHRGFVRADRDIFSHTGVNFFHRGKLVQFNFRNQFALRNRFGKPGSTPGFSGGFTRAPINPAFRSRGFVGRPSPAFPGVARPMTPAPNIGMWQNGWNNRNGPFFSPRSRGNFQNFQSSPAPSFGWRGGNTRSGGSFQGGGGFPQRGGFPNGGGGFRGFRGGRGFQGGGGFHGGFHGGEGGGGFQGSGGGRSGGGRGR
ncbi:MAG TPA: hypothetical protein VH280_23550 [Verrucomicrobiae bacterium]|jgi:hypothetical protein|nr:hypothetical protein [Verrucomicrobiae bacterium]